MTITYEYPNNELMRVCLRIEHLREGCGHFLNSTQAWNHQICLNLIIDALNLLDRPELRSKFAHELTRYHSQFLRLKETPKVDHHKLSKVIEELESQLALAHNHNGKFADDLRHNEFIHSILQQHVTPGGTCNFSTPGFHLWLQKHHEQRQADLKIWLQNFEDIFAMTQCLLHLTRNSASLQTHIAKEGFYQTTQDTKVSFQLIRVIVPERYTVFPRFSVGRHGISIRFLEGNLSHKAEKTENDVQFEMACCR